MRANDENVLSSSDILRRGLTSLDLPSGWNGKIEVLVSNTRKAVKDDPLRAPEVAVAALITFGLTYIGQSDFQARFARFSGFVLAMLEFAARQQGVGEGEMQRTRSLIAGIVSEGDFDLPFPIPKSESAMEMEAAA